MTVSQSLKAIHAYPVNDAVIENIAASRNLNLTDEVDRASANFKLAVADLQIWISLAPNINEGGVNIEIMVTDRKDLRERANRTYKELNDNNYLPPKVNTTNGAKTYGPTFDD